jgi:hypothetical protein
VAKSEVFELKKGRNSLIAGNEKRAPFLGPSRKEARWRENRKGVARRRSTSWNVSFGKVESDLVERWSFENLRPLLLTR